MTLTPERIAQLKANAEQAQREHLLIAPSDPSELLALCELAERVEAALKFCDDNTVNLCAGCRYCSGCSDLQAERMAAILRGQR